jgi:methionyl-tRNA formyltransferase
MRMEAGLDTGPMLLKVVTPISAETPAAACTTAWPKWARLP